MNNSQNITQFFKCLDSNSENCDDLNLTFGPDFSFNAVRARSNAAFREKGTPKEENTKNPGFFYNPRLDPANFNLPQDLRDDLGINDSNNTAFSIAEGISLSSFPEDSASVTTIDEGGVSRDGSPNSGIVQNSLDQQRVADQTIKVEGGNKAFPYISPLASTNFAGVEPIDPLGTLDNGENGCLYDPRLLDDEGIIYLRQYLSFDDTETGAVWRFQYAPQIAYGRSSTFQEDVTWGTNVQPAHFNNTSGKKVTIQGAILEGMTIGRTVTNAVKALETLMSVVDPDNQEQVAPYAYRLIVGQRTLTEPVSGRHAPFVIEQITVKEEMYDTKGEVLMYQVDLQLREVPYYQINDGRKLLLVTQNQRTQAQAICDTISQQLADVTKQVLDRSAQIEERLNIIQSNNSNDRERINDLINGDARTQIEINCREDSKAYSEYIELYKRYADNNCRTSKPVDGFYKIEEYFAQNTGLYEILSARPQGQDLSFFKGFLIFDENGAKIPLNQRAKTIRQRTQNAAIRKFLTEINTGLTESAAGSGVNDYLPACPHIYCAAVDVQTSVNTENLDYILNAADAMFANTENLNDIYPGGIIGAAQSVVAGIRARDIRPILPNVKKDLLAVNVVRQFLCTNSSESENLGYSNVENIAGKSQSAAEKIFNKTGEAGLGPLSVANNIERFRNPSIQAAACVLYAKTALDNTDRAASSNKCNREAVRFNLADQYEDYVSRLATLYNKIIEFAELSNIPGIRARIEEEIVSNTPCSGLIGAQANPFLQAITSLGGFILNNVYARGTYGNCRAAYAVVKTTKEIIKEFADIREIEDPFKNINLDV